MRAADELFLKSTKNWSLLAVLAAHADSSEPRKLLHLYWRQYQFKQRAPYRKETIEPFLKAAGIEIDDDTTDAPPPAHVTGPKYCPCCLGSYESTVTDCGDCEKVALRTV